MSLALDEALCMITVHSPGMWENDLSNDSIISSWHAVSDARHGGIVAYFASEDDAYRFRLNEINRFLNP